ncbi:ATP-binding protein [Streptomyces smyrnaeus]|uniref:ATP-binding protein n=1 Tax=Streptomyces TaxID=1883 RepID=UPI0015D46C45|nr:MULTISPECIES: ATP-binding protein [unclassified Streptomyces]MBQ0864275.1 ATP-binding protein [Streptomyces sp. RK75]MBQ1121440.1 ATP-binding protein [Streptomyces sp. B15]MBQ1157876.1 ATP-binding protein [Streptomyces sp. A73]
MYAAPARRDPAAASTTASPASGGASHPTAPPGRAEDPTWQLRFPAREQYIGRARLAFTSWLRERQDPSIPAETVDDAVLLLSELTTNAVVHTRCLPDAELVCRAALAPRETPTAALLRIEVHDHAEGDDRPQLKDSEAADESGRGLCIVAALAADWGVRPSTVTDGNTVWATLRLPHELPAT